MNEILINKPLLNGWEQWLKKRELAKNTIEIYTITINQYYKKYKKITKENFMNYKANLIEKSAIKTVNLKIQALSSLIDYVTEKENNDSYLKLKVKTIPVQRKNFLENVISKGEYLNFAEQLKKSKQMKWYMIVKFLGCTGARISELIKFNTFDVKKGYVDIVSKGQKLRRIYIPKHLKNEAIDWIGKREGFLFLNKFNKPMTTRGIAHGLKELAIKFGINADVVYPHSFRHMFAFNFLEKYKDIALLADLMGHSNIETTRIYLRLTSEQQQKIVDEVVDW